MSICNRTVATVATTCVAYKYCLLLYHMPALSMSGTRVDGVLVIKAATDRITFDDLIAHIECRSAGIESIDSK